MDQVEVLEKDLARSQTEVDYFVRFNSRQRIEHLVLTVTFVALAVTGLAEKFYTAGWANWLIMNFGGIAMTRLIHRAFGLVFILTIVYHFAFLIFDLGIRKNPASMLPTMTDVRNIFESMKYTFGFRDAHVEYGRYDYRQKFEYWGIVFGSLIMASTGIILVYPGLVTALFPGEVVAAARTAHGSEAMLAVLTIIIWHIYDTMLKPGIFPLDASIFTGRISRKRLEEEHVLEYEQLIQKQARATPQVQTQNVLAEENAGEVEKEGD